MAIIGMLILASIVFAPLLALPYREQQPGLILMIYYLATMGFTAFYAHYRRRRATGEHTYNFHSLFLPSWPLLLLATWGIMIIVEPLTELIPMSEEMEKQLTEIAASQDLFTGLTMVIAAPVLEEIVFRGIILDGFLKRFPPFHAILISALLFGLAHFNPWQFLLAAVLGGLLGWVYWRTRSLWPCLAIHFFANATGFFGRFFLSEEQLLSSSQELAGGAGNFTLLLAAAAAVLGGSIWLLNQLLPPAD